MKEDTIRVRVNRSVGELEVEGTEQQVTQWWDRLWPQISAAPAAVAASKGPPRDQAGGNYEVPEVFGEYYSDFRPDVPDVDKILIAGFFAQASDVDRVFTTKAANQLLLDQNIKVTNASQNVRRLIQAKRVFVVSDGRFRVSAAGIEHLKRLKDIE